MRGVLRTGPASSFKDIFSDAAALAVKVVSPTWLRLAMELRFELTFAAASAGRSDNNEA